MNFYLRSTIWACLLYFSSAQYHAQYRNAETNSPPSGLNNYRTSPASPARLSYSEPRQTAYIEPSRSSLPSTPRPLILTHQQTQTHDGGFKYAFAADNGLQQGETIAPDGTRSGAYSYVDPHGQQITVKYTAGKDGFRILEGPHKTPDDPQPQHPQQQQQQQEQQQSHYLREQSSLGAYSGAPQTFSAGQQEDRYTQAYHRSSVPVAQPHLTSLPRYLSAKNSQSTEEISANNNAIQQEPEYNDAPGKPYSFGAGYSFEFSG